MEILGYILFAVLWFIAVVWAYGVRIRPVVPATAASALYFLILALIVTFSDIEKIHLVWLIPVLYVMGFINPILINLPLIGYVLTMLASLYALILRLGIPANRISKAYSDDFIDTISNLKSNDNK